MGGQAICIWGFGVGCSQGCVEGDLVRGDGGDICE